MASNRVLVTGSTGRIGRLTLNLLREQPVNVVALSRAHSVAKLPSGTSYRIGDYEDVSSLTSALQDIDTLLFISSDGDAETMLRHHKNMVKAIQASAVKRVVYLSVVDIENDSRFYYSPVHRETESLLKALGRSTTFMRTGVFSEFFEDLWRRGCEGCCWIPAVSGTLFLTPAGAVATSLAKSVCCVETAPMTFVNSDARPQTIEEAVTELERTHHVKRSLMNEDLNLYEEKIRETTGEAWLARALASMFQSISENRFAPRSAE